MADTTSETPKEQEQQATAPTPKDITQQATAPTLKTKPDPKRVGAGKMVAERSRRSREAQKKPLKGRPT